MSLLKSFLTKGQEVKVEISDVTVNEVSSVIDGEHGEYRYVNINGTELALSNARIMFVDKFTPGCTAKLSVKEILIDEEPKTVASLTFV